MISAVFHPFLMAPATFAILLFGRSDFSGRNWLLFLLCFAATDLFPFFYVYRMKRRGETAGMDIPEHKKRFHPLLFSVMVYGLAFLGLLFWKASPLVTILMFAYMFNTMIAALISGRWKISIHGMAAGGPTAALGYAISGNFYWMFLLLPLLLFSRVKLQAHTPMQVIAGFILGFLLTIIQFRVGFPL